MDSTESESEHMEKSFEIDEQQETGPSKPKRARKEPLTSILAATFDRCKISEKDAVHLLVAFLEAVSLDPADYIINRTSIRNARAVYRESYDQQLKQAFTNLNVKSVDVHWDTKIMENISGKCVNRLAVNHYMYEFSTIIGSSGSVGGDSA
jgi:hypothetical protein